MFFFPRSIREIRDQLAIGNVPYVFYVFNVFWDNLRFSGFFVLNLWQMTAHNITIKYVRRTVRLKLKTCVPISNIRF